MDGAPNAEVAGRGLPNAEVVAGWELPNAEVVGAGVPKADGAEGCPKADGAEPWGLEKADVELWGLPNADGCPKADGCPNAEGCPNADVVAGRPKAEVVAGWELPNTEAPGFAKAEGVAGAPKALGLLANEEKPPPPELPPKALLLPAEAPNADVVGGAPNTLVGGGEEVNGAIWALNCWTAAVV